MIKVDTKVINTLNRALSAYATKNPSCTIEHITRISKLFKQYMRQNRKSTETKPLAFNIKLRINRHKKAKVLLIKVQAKKSSR